MDQIGLATDRSAALLNASEYAANGSAQQSNEDVAPSRPNLMGQQAEARPMLWGAIDLGPNYGHYGCGSEGSTAVPDRVAGVNLRPACDAHDACSDPIFERSDRSLGSVIGCQVEFASKVYKAGGGSWSGKIASTALAAIYTPVVAMAGVAQWGVNRILDAGEAVRGWFTQTP